MPELRAEATVVGDFNPNDEINRADKTSDWQGKLSGAYLFPYDVTVGANFDHQSGDAFARQVLLEGGVTIPDIVVNAEPIGTRRIPTLNLLTLRVEKSFRFRTGQRAGGEARSLQCAERQHADAAAAAIGRPIPAAAGDRASAHRGIRTGVQLLRQGSRVYGSASRGLRPPRRHFSERSAMTSLRFTTFALAAPVVGSMPLSGGQVRTQENVVTPVNDGPNPYRTIRNWGDDAGGKRVGRHERDRHRSRRQVRLGRRAMRHELCRLQPRSGAQVRRVRQAGPELWRRHVRVAAQRPRRSGTATCGSSTRGSRPPDELKKFPGEKVKGNIVVKFSPEGKVLLTLGKAGVAGDPPDAFTDPNDVVTAPNGDIYVSESHTNLDATPNAVARISVFDKNWKVHQDVRETGLRAGRVQDAARDGLRLPRPADRRRSGQPPHPDPRQGRQVPRVSSGTSAA